MNLKNYLNHPIFSLVQNSADELNIETYVVGGYVRDILLKRPSSDIDFVTVGSGIELAKHVAKKTGPHCNVVVYKNFGTAMLHFSVDGEDWQIEFVGARKESYRSNSRKPIVEDGSLEDDQKRRDFRINAMAIAVNADRFGELVDPFNGLTDLKNGILCTPLDPDKTFSDDPLRMMRAVRFAAQLNFSIANESFDAIRRNSKRIAIISKERISDELNKILMAKKPSVGFKLLLQCGLLHLIFPEIAQLPGVEYIGTRGHKDVFYHTMEVLDNVAAHSDNLWLRWAALLHDVGKPNTKRYDEKAGWTFHGHEVRGAKMVAPIFRKFCLPMTDKKDYVQKLVLLHLRPIILAEDIVTDSAVRRLLFDAGDDVEDLMLLCEADVTSKNPVKVRKFLANFRLVRKKLVELGEKDRIRNFQPPVSGEDIMYIMNMPPCKTIGDIKNTIKDAILDGIIRNDRAQALEMVCQEAEKRGITPRKLSPSNPSQK